MRAKRRSHGIAALSAGALASSFATPVSAADAVADPPPIDAAAAAASDVALRAWEAERGIDVPDDLFHKLGDAPQDLEAGAFLEFVYQPPTIAGVHPRRCRRQSRRTRE